MYKKLFFTSVIAGIIATTLGLNSIFIVYCILSAYIVLYTIEKREVIAQML